MGVAIVCVLARGVCNKRVYRIYCYWSVYCMVRCEFESSVFLCDSYNENRNMQRCIPYYWRNVIRAWQTSIATLQHKGNNQGKKAKTPRLLPLPSLCRGGNNYYRNQLIVRQDKIIQAGERRTIYRLQFYQQPRNPGLSLGFPSWSFALLRHIECCLIYFPSLVQRTCVVLVSNS